MGERLAYLEELVGDSVEKHEQLEVDQQEFRNQQDNIRSEHHADVSARLEYLEKMMGDSADKHAEFEATHMKMQQRLDESHDKHAELADRHHQHATLSERVDYLEQLLQDSADKHAQHAEELKRHADKHMQWERAHKGWEAVHKTVRKLGVGKVVRTGSDAGSGAAPAATAAPVPSTWSQWTLSRGRSSNGCNGSVPL